MALKRTETPFLGHNFTHQMINYDLDTTKAVTHVSLCAGYGGIDLGLKRAIPNLRTIAFSEIEAYACANLVAKMEAGLLDPAPVWTDLKTFPWDKFRGCVDILSGGYPCQPFSSAGKRLGKDDPRHLWPWIADGISTMRPSLVFFENVEGHITLGLREVIGDLESLGYSATWGIFSAAEVGAPHARKRIFILANANGVGVSGSGNVLGKVGPNGQGGTHSAPHSQLFDEWLADANGCGRVKNRLPSELRPVRVEQSSRDCGPSDPRQAEQIWPARPSQPQFAWEPPRVVGNATGFNGSRQAAGQRKGTIRRTSSEQFERQAQPAVGGNADGPAHRLDYVQLCVAGDSRVDELRLLGNGVVPATAALAFTTLAQRLSL